MTVDFEALDLVRGENKSRSYNKRIDELQQRNQQLQELVAQMVKELPVEKRWSFEERLKKIQLDIYPIVSYMYSAPSGETVMPWPRKCLVPPDGV